MASEQALKARVNGLGDRNQARHRAGPRGWLALSALAV